MQAFTTLATLAAKNKSGAIKGVKVYRSQIARLENGNRRMASLIKKTPRDVKKLRFQANSRCLAHCTH